MFKPSVDPELSEEELISKDVARVKRANEKRDMQKLIQLVLASPMYSGDVRVVDGEAPIDSFKKANTDMQSRIIINAAIDAATGDAKARDFLFKYGGFEPVREQSISMDRPIIIDDMTVQPDTVEEVQDGQVPEEAMTIYDDGTVD